LRKRDLLKSYSGCPVIGCGLGLSLAFGCYFGVGPGGGAVSVFERPVALFALSKEVLLILVMFSKTYIPRKSPVITFCDIVISLSMSSHEQHFIVHILPT
jgi:hypothetical protein